MKVPSTVHVDAQIALRQCFDAVKERIGARAFENALKLSTSSAAGGLRIVFNRALSMINKYGTPGTFVNGNTIDYGFSLPRNYAVLCSYALPDVACQLMYPSGYAVAPVPFTEAIRIPEPKEIIEAQLTMDMVIEKAPYYARYIDWEKVNADAEILVTGANTFFERVLNGLDDMGVDINHAGEIVSVLKAIGPEQLETAFGSGKRDDNAMRGRIPVRPTSIVQTITKIEDDAVAKHAFSGEGPLAGITVLVGSTDVNDIDTIAATIEGYFE